MIEESTEKKAAMNGTGLLLAAAVMVATTGTAHAQMRVEGFKQVDPRLRQQRIETPALNLPPRVDGESGGADVAVPDRKTPSGQNTMAAKKAEPTPSIPDRPVPARASAQAGPLQRPTYLQPDQSQAPAGGPSSLDLMKQCFDGSISGSIANPSCVGYMAGFIGAVRISGSIGPGYPICLPESGLSNESIVADVSAYLEENPPSLQKSARSVVFLVLSQRYPCAEK